MHDPQARGRAIQSSSGFYVWDFRTVKCLLRPCWGTHTISPRLKVRDDSASLAGMLGKKHS